MERKEEEQRNIEAERSSTAHLLLSDYCSIEQERKEQERKDSGEGKLITVCVKTGGQD